MQYVAISIYHNGRCVVIKTCGKGTFYSLGAMWADSFLRNPIKFASASSIIYPQFGMCLENSANEVVLKSHKALRHPHNPFVHDKLF